MTVGKGAWRNGAAAMVAGAALAAFGLLGVVLASTHVAGPSVHRVGLPHIASATISVAAVGWRLWDR